MGREEGEEKRGGEGDREGEEKAAEKAKATMFCCSLNSSHIPMSSAHSPSQMLGLKICSMLMALEWEISFSFLALQTVAAWPCLFINAC